MELDFGNTPVSPDGSTLVDAIGYESNDINRNQLKHQKKHYGFIAKNAGGKIMRLDKISRPNNQRAVQDKKTIAL